MIIEKGKTLNGYAISVLFMKNNADLWLSGRYFFMEITKSNTKTDKSFWSEPQNLDKIKY